jgi:hypothetical protein
MLGEAMSDDDKAYYAKMDAQIAAMPQDQQKALIKAIKLMLRTFVEEDTQGVLVVASTDGYLTTLGLNANFLEAASIVRASAEVFADSFKGSDEEMKH